MLSPPINGAPTMAKLILTILIALSGCQPKQDSAFSELGVVRIDAKAKRVFIVKPEAFTFDIEKLKEHLSSVRDAVVKNHPDWSDSWSASYFSEERLVGYKDEPHIRQPLNSGEWSKGYLVEYSSREQLATLFPLIPEKYRQIRLQ